MIDYSKCKHFAFEEMEHHFVIRYEYTDGCDVKSLTKYEPCEFQQMGFGFKSLDVPVTLLIKCYNGKAPLNYTSFEYDMMNHVLLKASRQDQHVTINIKYKEQFEAAIMKTAAEIISPATEGEPRKSWYHIEIVEDPTINSVIP